MVSENENAAKATLHCSRHAALRSITADSAIFLNPNGLGEVLVYPYYTVNGGNSTLLTLVNTTSLGKAVKVRVLEGYNGRDVLDFNLYLSPFDEWVGTVLPVGTGAGLFTRDNSCTVPKLPSDATSALAFSTKAFDGTGTQGTDGGPTDATRTREGQIEVVEMGVVKNGLTGGSLLAITHTHGVPISCPQVVDAWGPSGYWTADSQTDLDPPSGGLSGSGTLLNVALGTVEAYNADAIAQFYIPGSRGSHTNPASLTPNIASGTSLTASIYANDSPFALTYARGIDAVSALFMADKITNDYWTSASIDASSEWVITYPTKRFYTDPFYVNDTPVQPFQGTFVGSTSSSAKSPSSTPPTYSSREENIGPPGCLILCPGLQPNPALNYVAQVITFNQTNIKDLVAHFTPNIPTKILASSLSPMNINTFTGAYGTGAVPNENGWASIDLRNGSVTHQLTAVDGSILLGQPVTGFWVTQFVNGNVGGALANYTALYRHKLHASCVKADGTTPCS
jgi:hypothetical protein